MTNAQSFMFRWTPDTIVLKTGAEIKKLQQVGNLQLPWQVMDMGKLAYVPTITNITTVVRNSTKDKCNIWVRFTKGLWAYSNWNFEALIRIMMVQWGHQFVHVTAAAACAK